MPLRKRGYCWVRTLLHIQFCFITAILLDIRTEIAKHDPQVFGTIKIIIVNCAAKMGRGESVPACNNRKRARACLCGSYQGLDQLISQSQLLRRSVDLVKMQTYMHIRPKTTSDRNQGIVSAADDGTLDEPTLQPIKAGALGGASPSTQRCDKRCNIPRASRYATALASVPRHARCDRTVQLSLGANAYKCARDMRSLCTPSAAAQSVTMWSTSGSQVDSH